MTYTEDDIQTACNIATGDDESTGKEVIRDEKISSVPFKITGKFILGGLQTGFR